VVTPPPDVPAATTVPARTLAPQATLDTGAAGTAAPVVTGPPILIRYEVQAGERLLKIAETFGTTRPAIVQANTVPGEEENPRDARPGDIIVVPVSPDMTEQQIMAVPGFVEFVED
jgi:hypothetical protein